MALAKKTNDNQVYRLGATCLTCTLAYLDQIGATATRAHSLMIMDDYCNVAGARRFRSPSELIEWQLKCIIHTYSEK